MNEAPSYYERADRHLVSRVWQQNIVDLVKGLMPVEVHRLKHLDVGCGDGVKIRRIKPQGKIIGIDVDKGMLAAAQRKGIETIQADAVDLSVFKQATFDLVTCLDVIEHVEHSTLALAEICRVLRKRGFLILTTPNVTISFRIVWWLWTLLGPGKYWKECPHVHTYNLWKPTQSGMSLIDRLRDVGLKPERTAKTNLGMLVGVRAIKL